MNTPIKLSVVIPLFNSREYLPALMDSLLAQTRAPDEIIFIDDGSTDGSGEMVAHLGAGLQGLRIVRQENQGQAVARNTGLALATGEYLSFIDSDDILLPDMYAILLSLAEGEQLDIAMCNARNFYEGRREDTIIFRDIKDTGVIAGETWLQQRLLSGYFPHYCWLQLYRRDFITRHGFIFPLADPHEDVLWVTRTLLAAQRFRFSPEPGIRYRKKEVWAKPPTPSTRTGLPRNKRIESALHNTLGLIRIVEDDASLQPLTRELIRRDCVNGGCNLIRSVRRLSDRRQQRSYLDKIREAGMVQRLWGHAKGMKESWRVMRYGLLSRM